MGICRTVKTETLCVKHSTKEKARRLILIQELWDTCQQFILYVPQFGRMCPVGIVKVKRNVRLGIVNELQNDMHTLK